MPTNTDKFKDIAAHLTVLEAVELAKFLDEKWGLSTGAIPISFVAAPPGSVLENERAVAKDGFDVILTGAGNQKINVIKEVRAITGLGLKEAKDLVEGAPRLVREALEKDEAIEIKQRLEAAGGTVNIPGFPSEQNTPTTTNYVGKRRRGKLFSNEMQKSITQSFLRDHMELENLTNAQQQESLQGIVDPDEFEALQAAKEQIHQSRVLLGDIKQSSDYAHSQLDQLIGYLRKVTHG